MATRTEGIQVLGAKELRATLKRAGDDLADLKGAHGAAAQVVTGSARAGAPKRSGRLAANVRGSGAATSATIRAGGASVPYAGPIHFGWPGHNIEPQPFITEAAQRTEPVWVGLYTAAVDKILGRVHGV